MKKGLGHTVWSPYMLELLQAGIDKHGANAAAVMRFMNTLSPHAKLTHHRVWWYMRHHPLYQNQYGGVFKEYAIRRLLCALVHYGCDWKKVVAYMSFPAPELETVKVCAEQLFKHMRETGWELAIPAENHREHSLDALGRAVVLFEYAQLVLGIDVFPVLVEPDRFAL